MFAGFVFAPLLRSHVDGNLHVIVPLLLLVIYLVNLFLLSGRRGG